jgi:hypothetical protein
METLQTIYKTKEIHKRYDSRFAHLGTALSCIRTCIALFGGGVDKEGQ